MKKFIIFLIPIILPIAFQILWDVINFSYKELTIEECRNIPINNIYGSDFSVYYLDSIKMDNKYSVKEYRITNTGNTTILGFGDKSDILTETNKLPIINNLSDLKLIRLMPNKIAKIDDKNRLTFKQWKPKEYIDIICISTNDSIIDISDRDIKDVNVIYKKIDGEITQFEKLSMTTKLIEVICYSINVILVILYLISDFIYKCKLEKKLNPTCKQYFIIINYVLWCVCLLYLFSIPIRWIL